MKVACLQMDISFGNIAENVKRAAEQLAAVMQGKPDVVVLPELWTTGYDLTRLSVLGDVDGAHAKSVMSDWAKAYGVNIVGGSIAKRTHDSVTNTMYMFNRSGEVVGEYSKVHLFQLMDEHKFLAPGSDEGQFAVDNVPCAGFICYDIRFPEWLRVHTAKGAEVLFVVAEWPLPRLAHWRTLLTARAIENQCYVVACNRAGSDPNNVFAGHSMMIDPWGEVVAEAGEGEETLIGTLDFMKIPEVRRGIPVFEDRRPDLYK